MAKIDPSENCSVTFYPIECGYKGLTPENFKMQTFIQNSQTQTLSYLSAYHRGVLNIFV